MQPNTSITTTVIVSKKNTTKPLLSICIPTNGVSDWVFPVLESIYSQKIDDRLFEVVLMDNGNDPSFKEKATDYANEKNNLLYATTTAQLFLSELQSYRSASGVFIKFINHRSILQPGSLQYLIDFIKKNSKKKPIVYFANGCLKTKEKIQTLPSFDLFVRGLGYWLTWSSGMGFWKEDFDTTDLSTVNELFPHTAILFSKKDRETYLLDNTILFEDLPQGKKPKGNYNLFHAFAVEFPDLMLGLWKAGDISAETFFSVKQSLLGFLQSLYYTYIFRKVYCSYDLSNYKDEISVFYSLHQVKKKRFWLLAKEMFGRLFKFQSLR